MKHLFTQKVRTCLLALVCLFVSYQGQTAPVVSSVADPSVVLSTTAPATTNAPYPVTITFSEAVTGFTISDLIVTNGTLSGLSTSDNITYRVTLTPLADGVTTINLPAGAAVNIAGNGNSASNTLSVIYDVTAPVINTVSVPAAGAYKNGSRLDFTVNYSEAVIVNTAGGTPSLPVIIGTTVVQAAFTGTNGTTGLNFSYTVQNGDVDPDGIVLGSGLSLNGSTIRDVAGNNASAIINGAGNTPSVLVDGTAPVVNNVQVPVNGYYKAGNNLNFTVNASENVTVTGTPYIDVIIGSATVHAVYMSGSGTSSLLFRYTVAAGDMDMDGISAGNTINLNGGTLRDAVGNDLVLALNNVGNTANVLVNTATPTVTLSTAASSPTNVPYTVTAVFSEPVTGLTLGDFVVTNGTASNLQTSNNITYNILVTPAADGASSISLPAGAAINIGGNSTAASNTLTVVYDATAPVISSVDVPAAGYYKTGNVLSFTVHFSKNVTLAGGTPSLAITIGSSTVQAVYASGSGSNAYVFAYTVQPGDQDLDGIALAASLQLNGSTIRDAAGNNAVTTLNSAGSTSSVFVYSAVPAVQLSGTPASNAPFTLTIRFSETVTGFTASDIAAANASISNLQTADNMTYTALVTPVADGTVSLQVPAGAAVNIASAGNTASNTISYVYDGTAPVISSVIVPANGYYHTGDNLDFTVHYSETLTVSATGGTPSLPLTIGSATVQAQYVNGSGSNSLLFRYTVKDGDMDNDGITLASNLQLNGSSMSDASGNNAALQLNNAGSTAGVLVNTAHPSVALATAAAPVVNTPVNISITFSEAVTGFTAGDITANNATVGNLQTTDNIRFTALVTPTADGAVSLNIAANTAANIAGNGNTASNTIGFTYDATAPVIAAGQTFVAAPTSAAGTIVGHISATEAIGTLQNWVLASDPSGGAFGVDASGNIVVNNTSALGSYAGATVALSVTVSDGLNTSIATAVNVQINAVNQAPTLDIIADVSVCANTDTHTLQLTGASAVEPGQTYSFSVSSSQPIFDVLRVNNSGVLSYQLKNNASGSAVVTVTIKDNGGTAFGGVDTLRRSFTVTVNSLPVVAITSDKGQSISKGDTVHLTASGGDVYNWSDASGIIGGVTSSVLEAKPLINTSYQVTATTAAGCTATASFAINVVEDFKIDATNILTPNGDGRNDRWIIHNIESYPNNEVKIFDRAGRLVFSRKNYGNDWEGKTNGTMLAEGTYYYIVTINNGAKIAKGYITIIRDRF